jgi:hypothetical protein
MQRLLALAQGVMDFSRPLPEPQLIMLAAVAVRGVLAALADLVAAALAQMPLPQMALQILVVAGALRALIHLGRGVQASLSFVMLIPSLLRGLQLVLPQSL